MFKSLPGVGERPRSGVEVLKVTDYSVFTRALGFLVSDWLKGVVGSGAPSEPWELDAIRQVNKLNRACAENTDELNGEVRVVYDHLIKLKVPGHLRNVTSHRKWIRGTLKVLKKVGVEFSDAIDNLIWRHDLSKYSHKEVLGYAIMFGDGNVDFRQLQTPEEKFEWENTLYNHYAHNPHHPEYFYPLQEDGTRKRDKSVSELDPVHGEDYLIEGAVDMLAANGERLLAEDPVIDVKKWFHLADRYYKRYSADDAEFVRDKIEGWATVIRNFLAKEGNGEKLQGIFDQRPITYE